MENKLQTVVARFSDLANHEAGYRTTWDWEDSFTVFLKK